MELARNWRASCVEQHMTRAVRSTSWLARVATCLTLASTGCSLPPTEQTTATWSPVELSAASQPLPRSPPPRAAAAPADRATAENLDDGRIRRVLSVIAAAGRRVARLALSRSKTPRVRGLARQAEDTYGAIQQALMAVGHRETVSSVESRAASQLRTAGHDRRQALMGQFDEEFDRAYTIAQILECEEAQRVLYTELLPHAKDTRLKSALESSNARVGTLLAEAISVRESTVRQ